jgi:glycosyltransferase involved in cell wall biosynthesis
VTTTDAGGPLDVVADRATGLVTAPRADELAQALRYLRDHPAEGQEWGRAGRVIAERVTWDAAIERLLG